MNPRTLLLLPLLLFLTACDRAPTPAPAVPAAPAPAAQPGPTPPPAQQQQVQPATQQPPAPAAPLPGLPIPEYTIAWGELRSDPESGDKQLSMPEEVDALLFRLQQDQSGFFIIAHQSGRFLRAAPHEDGYHLEFHDPSTRTFLRRDTIAEIGEVAFVFHAFRQGHTHRPPDRGWKPFKP
jgi:hypothetical protein